MVGSAKEDTPEKKRSHNFLREEVVLLLRLIEKYKLFVLNKSTNAAANRAKDAAWAKISKQFNEANLKHERSADTLKKKWENLKKTVKKSSINIIDSDSCELDDVDSRIISLVSAAESISIVDTPQDISEDDTNQMDNNENESDVPKDVESDGESDDNHEKNTRIRGQNFSPQESKLLLQCVRKEKKYVFCKEITSKAIEVKNQAWSRIADSYNKLSPRKRSAKCLRMKFTSMKKLARKLGSKDMPMKNIVKRMKHEELMNDSFESIKKEPFYDEKMDEESEQYSDNDDNDFKDDLDTGNGLAAIPSDPLSSVLNSDSGIGSSTSQMAPWNWNQSDNKEIVKLQTELLNYQMETAKMERKRVEEAMQEEARERSARATERALRLRAARLAAAGAALALPPAHPALAFPADETPALHYLNHYQHT